MAVGSSLLRCIAIQSLLWDGVDNDGPIDLFELSRTVERLEFEYRNWVRSPKNRLESLLLPRRVAGIDLYRRLAKIPFLDPLLEPAKRWIYFLCEQRIQAPIESEKARLQLERSHRNHVDGGLSSIVQLRAALLGDSLTRRRRFDDYQKALGASSEIWTIGEAQLQEFSERSGLDRQVFESADEAWNESSTQSLLESWAESACFKSSYDWYEAGLGLKTVAEFPRTAAWHHLSDCFRQGTLLKGAELGLSAAPQIYGIASHLRAWATFGAALERAYSAPSQCFLIRRDPYGLRREIFAALFASLPSLPSFAERELGVAKCHLREHERQMAMVKMAEFGSLVMRAWARPRLIRAAASTREEWRMVEHELLGFSLGVPSPELAFPHSAYSLVKLQAQGAAMELAEDFLQRFDSDWYRNPAAHDEIRAMLDKPPAVKLESSQGSAQNYLHSLRRSLL